MGLRLKKDFVSIYDYPREWFEEIFDSAGNLKKKLKNCEEYQPLKGKTLVMIFQKPSARTRISFEVGMYQLGGSALYLAPADIKIGSRESVADTARVLSRYNDCIMARLFDHEHIIELAEYSTVPVINGLTDLLHPCQIVADCFTILEHKGTVENLKIVYIGDGNNIANSWINMAAKFPMELTLCTPDGYDPDKEILEKAVKSGVSAITIERDPFTAVKGADVVYTDVWTSMGMEGEEEKRKNDFQGYQVNEKLLKEAKEDCIVMHCLPAHRGEEISDAVIEGRQSVVFDEAENRLHVQKAVMLKLML
ncbi:ornithine carbamoyltransferase [bacterium]|nr:ornithine carbamoyltransferase [bacterium]